MAERIRVYFIVVVVWSTLLWILERFWQRSCQRKARTQNGCSVPRKLPASDSFMGVMKLRESAARIKDGSYLELSRTRFLTVGANTYASKALGKTIIDTSEPANIRAILATRFKDWALGDDRKRAFSPLLGHGIFAADGHYWRSSRTALRPSFANDHLARLEVFEDRFQSMLRAITDRSGELDLSEAFGCFTLDCTTEIFFGKSYNTLETHFQHPNDPARRSDANASAGRFVEAFSRCQRTMADNLVLGKLGRLLMGTKGRKQFDEDCHTVHDFVGEAVNHALRDLKTRSSESTSTSFLHSLLEDEQSPSDISSALINILVAGRDTTASLLSNLWFELARNSSIYQRMVREVQEVLAHDAGSIPTLQDLNSMPYLQACINEALRLYPPVPLNSRTAICDTILPIGGGNSGQEPLFIPRGTRVAYNIYAMHRRKDLWGETAEKFGPERWIKQDGSMIQPGWEYLPFNGGPRICIGQNLALTQVRFVTCRLVQHFRGLQAGADNMTSTIPAAASRDKAALSRLGLVAPASSWRWKESLTLTCTSARGTHVMLEQ